MQELTGGCFNKSGIFFKGVEGSFKGRPRVPLKGDIDIDVNVDIDTVSRSWGFCSKEFGDPLNGFGVDARQF